MNLVVRRKRHNGRGRPCPGVRAGAGAVGVYPSVGGEPDRSAVGRRRDDKSRMRICAARTGAIRRTSRIVDDRARISTRTPISQRSRKEMSDVFYIPDGNVRPQVAFVGTYFRW